MRCNLISSAFHAKSDIRHNTHCTSLVGTPSTCELYDPKVTLCACQMSLTSHSLHLLCHRFHASVTSDATCIAQVKLALAKKKSFNDRKVTHCVSDVFHVTDFASECPQHFTQAWASYAAIIAAVRLASTQRTSYMTQR
jgi:hypothetical protein